MDSIYLMLSSPGSELLMAIIIVGFLVALVITAILHLFHTSSDGGSFANQIFTLQQAIASCDNDDKVLEMSAEIDYLQKHLNRSKKHLMVSLVIFASTVMISASIPSKVALMDKFLKQHDCTRALQLKTYIRATDVDKEVLREEYDKVCKE